MNIPAHLKPFEVHFLYAGEVYGVRPEVLAAICERESRGGLALTPPGPAGRGDQGHGHGLMQIDDRAHPGFVSTGLWRAPSFCILYAARLLRDNLNFFGGDEFNAVAAYNCGPGNVKKAIKNGLSGEAYTAHGNYATDVLKHAEDWHENEG